MRKGVQLAFLTAIISGVSIFINKFGVSGINPFMFTFAKNLVVGIFLLSIIILFRKFDEIKALSRKDWLKLCLVGLVGGSVPFLLFFYALKMTSAQNAAFIHKTLFVWVTILAVFFLREKVNKSYIAGALLLVAANILLLAISPLNLGIGELLILIATLLWSAEITLSKHILKNMSSNIVAFGRMFFGSIFILVFLLSTGNMALLTMPQIGWVGITSIFLFGYVFTFYAALKLEKASVVTPILLLGSFITLALNAVYTQSISPVQIIGSVVMIIGLFFVLRDALKETHKAVLLF